MPKPEKRAVLVIVDGWGYRAEKKSNAIAAALTPHYSRLLGEYPNGLLSASGLDVGLPDGVMGNSEVGHMNIGSGRKVLQDQVRIHEAIDLGTFFENRLLKEAMDRSAQGKARLHLMGLVSPGNVHSAERHYLSLIQMAASRKISKDRLFVHAILDGRDTPPKSAEEYLSTLEKGLEGKGRIATISGRYYTMDRDKRWERTDLGYRSLVLGEGHRALDAHAALHAAYARGETDEFVLPTAIVDSHQNPIGSIASGDVVICFNFRPDRMRQIVRALTVNDAPIPSLRSDLKIELYCMTTYDKTFQQPVLFDPQDLSMCAGEAISKAGCRQFRTAETEKYAHVTYFFNGGREAPFEGEDRQMIQSPKVATYDLQPEMSSVEVTKSVVDRIHKVEDTLIVINYAQPDMVGHTGKFDAAVAAVEATDRGFGAIAEAASDLGFMLFITADHGNVEMMEDPVTGQPHTAHTLNPVPFLCIAPHLRGQRVKTGGALCDVIPTIFSELGLPKPSAMTGESLLHRV